MQINKQKTKENINYLGWDEDHYGEWDEWFMCPACKENNYISIYDNICEMCSERIEWTD